jgi:toxin ParE1/3/4
VIVTWSAQARRDLESIHAYIAREASPERALGVISDIVEAVNRLERFPGLGRASRRPGVRELVVARQPYIVPYRVRNDTVIVLRVLHTARQRT